LLIEALKGLSIIAMGEAHRIKKPLQIKPCKGEIIDFDIITPLQGLLIITIIIDGLHPSLMYPALSGLIEMS